MLVICLFYHHGDENCPRPGNSSGTNQDHWRA